MRKLLSVVVPMYFEEMAVRETYRRLSEVLQTIDMDYEIIFVNDGSTDKTLPLLEEIAATDRQVRIISFSRNFGHQIAVTAGLSKTAGDAVVIIDGDLQDPPELIPEMVRLWREGYDVVYAQRKKRKGESWFKLLSAKAYYRVLAKMTDVTIPVDTGDFRLLDRKVVEAFRRINERNRYLRGIISWLGFQQTPLEYEREQRFAGDTKYPFKKMLRLAMDGILSFSFKPLKLTIYMGVTAVPTGLLLAVVTVLHWLVSGKSYSPASLLIASLVLFMGGVQLLSVGLIGEYIGRIYDESKGRPLYIVEKEINF